MRYRKADGGGSYQKVQCGADLQLLSSGASQGSVTGPGSPVIILWRSLGSILKHFMPE